jgi:hypothetical protein
MGQDRAVAAVVLVDASGCQELDAVERLLDGALGTPSVRISAEQLVTLHVSLELETGVLTVGTRRIRPTVAWIRHARAPSLWAYQGQCFQTESWSSFLSQITAAAAVCVPGREPGHVEQLVAARRLGVATPRTTVTTDAASWPAHWAAAVVKALGLHFAGPPERTEPFLPQVVDRSGEPPPWATSRTPVIVQEYVEHVQELRVYYLNGAVCAFDVRKPSPAAIWLLPSRVEIGHTECPRAAAVLVHRLAAQWGLRYGAFDLLVTAAGELVFLEVNTDGDWLWFEGRAGWRGVTFMAAAMVRDLHVRALHGARVA